MKKILAAIALALSGGVIASDNEAQYLGPDKLYSLSIKVSNGESKKTIRTSGNSFYSEVDHRLSRKDEEGNVVLMHSAEATTQHYISGYEPRYSWYCLNGWLCAPDLVGTVSPLEERFDVNVTKVNNSESKVNVTVFYSYLAGMKKGVVEIDGMDFPIDEPDLISLEYSQVVEVTSEEKCAGNDVFTACISAESLKQI
jgi:hypothetical protein